MLFLLSLLLSVSASAEATRLLWWELPGAVKADKRPFFQALNLGRRNTGEGSLLANYATALVLCEIQSPVAERDCPVWRKQIAYFANGPVSLSSFAGSPENSAFLLQAFAGMLTGARESLSPAGRGAAAALLAQTGATLAGESDAKLLALVRSSGALWAEAAQDPSLRAFRNFVTEFTAWLAAKPASTSLRLPEYPRAFAVDNGMCRIAGKSVECEGVALQGIPPALNDPQQLVHVRSGLCVLDGHEVKCWNSYQVDPSRDPGYLVAPENLKNAYFLMSDSDNVCALDEEGLKCWTAQMSTPDVHPHAPLLSAPGRRYLAVAGYTRGTLCGLNDFGIRCWINDTSDDKDFYREITPSIHDPRLVSYAQDGFCVSDTDGVKCFTESYLKPVVVNPVALGVAHQLVGGAKHTCWLAGGAVKCDGDDVYGQASPPPGLGSVRAIAAGENTSCALDESGWSCWGKYRSGKGAPPKELRKPRLLAAGDKYTFALDAEGLKGWGNFLELPPRYGLQDVRFLLSSGAQLYYATSNALYLDGKVNRVLRNPREIAVAAGEVCVIDDDGLRCRDWQGRLDERFHAAKSPRGIALGYEGGCWIDDDGVKCVYVDSSMAITQPQFKPVDPVALAFVQDYACVVESAGSVRCWKWGRQPYQPDFKISGLKKFAGDYLRMCALDDAGVRCWNEKGLVPVPVELHHPFELTVGGGHACAIDDDGVKCWGEGTDWPRPLPTLKEN